MAEPTVETTLPTIDEIRTAQDLVYSVMLPTPQLVWPLISERLGNEVWIKHENHTPTGAFKARTAVVYAAELFRESSAISGLVTATRGNHGQSVALAARRFGVQAHIVVPRGNSVEKNDAMRAQGGSLIEYGNDYQESKEQAQRLAAEKGWHFVPSYHPDIVKGVATYWLEFFSAVPTLDVVYVPIGQGSGICSCVAVRNGLHLKTKNRWRGPHRCTSLCAFVRSWTARVRSRHHPARRWHGVPGSGSDIIGSGFRER